MSCQITLLQLKLIISLLVCEHILQGVPDVIPPDPELMFEEPDSKLIEVHRKTSFIEFQGGF